MLREQFEKLFFFRHQGVKPAQHQRSPGNAWAIPFCDSFVTPAGGS
jgi:hypothetical protein